MKKAIFAAVLAVALCFTLFAGCADNNENEPDVIKVGFIGPLSGEDAATGVAVLNGVKMYIDELNAIGGIRAKKIELIEYDDESDPAQAINGFNRLVEEEKVVCIFSGSVTEPTTAIAQESSDFTDPIPVITATSSLASTTTYGKNLFRVCLSDSDQSIAIAKFASEVLEAETASVLYNADSDNGSVASTAFQTECANVDIELLGTGYYEDDTDEDGFADLIESITEADPDVVFVPGDAARVAEIIKILKDGGITATLLGTSGWDGIIGKVEDPSILENSYFASDFAADDPDVEEFVTKYEEKYGEKPTASAAAGYDAALVMFDAIKRAGNIERAAIITALGETDIEATTGQIKFENQSAVKESAIVSIKTGDDGELGYIFDSRI